MKEWVKIFKDLSLVIKISFVIIFVFALGTGFLWYQNLSLAHYHDGNIRTINSFLTNMFNEEYSRAYAIFAKKYKNEEDFKMFQKGSLDFKKVYKEYRQGSFTVNKTTRYLLPIFPQTIEYKGEFTYENGKKAEVMALFIWEDEEWRLYIIDVT